MPLGRLAPIRETMSTRIVYTLQYTDQNGLHRAQQDVAYAAGAFLGRTGSGSPERGSFVRKRGGMTAAQRGYAGAN